MKKNLLAGVTLLAVASLLAGCPSSGPVDPDDPGASANKLVYWSPFGAGYTTALTRLVDSFNEQYPSIKIDNQSQGSYDKLQTNINNSVSTHTFPNFANGYPDHFAGYIMSNIQVELDEFVEAYDEAHKEELEAQGLDSIIDDYYDQYMVENMNLKYDMVTNEPYLMGVPFNKSTELLGYNGWMFDYIKSKDSSITRIPETYAEWATVGPKIRTVVIDNLAGKKLYGKTDKNGTASDFVITDKDADAPSGEGLELLCDCSNVNATNFKVLAWDALDNMFITLVRQWGGQYTSYTSQDMKIYKHGWATFWDANNKQKTLDALKTIDDLHTAKIFGTAAESGDSSFNSDAFKANQTFSMVCSSGGLSYNIENNRLRLAPIPYKDAEHKFVISQGTNLGLFDQGDDKDLEDSFTAMVALSTGELQAKWAVETGYYPASKSAYSSETYQTLLKTEYTEKDALKRAYQESAVLNANIYMSEEAGWTKFVDPGFNGSSTIRKEVASVIDAVISRNAGVKIESIMDDVVDKMSTYIKK